MSTMYQRLARQFMRLRKPSSGHVLTVTFDDTVISFEADPELTRQFFSYLRMLVNRSRFPQLTSAMRRTVDDALEDVTNVELRAWARENGWPELTGNGGVSNSIRHYYYFAHLPRDV